MNISNKGLDLIKKYEGFRSEAYPDPITKKEPWTIGYGTTKYPNGSSVIKGQKCTESQAEEWLKYNLSYFENLVRQNVKVQLNQNQFDALCSILYNVGPGSKYKSGIITLKDGRPSTLLRKLNEGDFQGAADEFLSWISKGTSAERGLTRRRQEERLLFLGEI